MISNFKAEFHRLHSLHCEMKVNHRYPQDNYEKEFQFELKARRLMAVNRKKKKEQTTPFLAFSLIKIMV